MNDLVRFLSRISIRLLAFNILLVFLPFFGILSLRTYEQHLLEVQERSMVQQGRLLAAALGDNGPLRAEDAERILVNLRQRLEARLRVLDDQSRLLADSSRLGPRREPEAGPADAGETEVDPRDGTRESWLYRLGRQLYKIYEWFFPAPQPPLAEDQLTATGERLEGAEIRKALQGRYGGALRVSPDGRSITLFSAIPIRNGQQVIGVALVSKSTFPILRALDDLRLQAFKVVLVSATVAVVLSLLVSTTIARPLRRLRHEAKVLLDRRGRLKGSFKALERSDEIGDLSRALQELTRRLEGHISFIETFASDVSHEFKNPLATIRNATEILADIDDPAQRRRFLSMTLREVARLENLLSGVREITQIDAQIDEAPREIVRLDELLERLVEQFEMRAAGPRFRLLRPDREVEVSAVPDRLVQVFENLLDNATSFSPHGAEVRLELEVSHDRALVRVEDRGPGIPEEHLEKIFHRFFSYRRKDENGQGHTGLGLAIARAILEAAGGRLRARNAAAGGAVFEVELPLAE